MRILASRVTLKQTPTETEQDCLGGAGRAVAHPFSAQPQVLEFRNESALYVLELVTQAPVRRGRSLEGCGVPGFTACSDDRLLHHLSGCAGARPPIHLVFIGIILTCSSGY